jgi:signal transduction histidine kinase
MMEKLGTVAAVTESQIQVWLDSQRSILALLSDSLVQDSYNQPLPVTTLESSASSLSARADQHSTPVSNYNARIIDQFQNLPQYEASELVFSAIFLLDPHGKLLATHPPGVENQQIPELSRDQAVILSNNDSDEQALSSTTGRYAAMALFISQPVPGSELALVARIESRALSQLIDQPFLGSQGSEIYLVLPSYQTLGLYPNSNGVNSVDALISSDLGDIRHSSAIDAAMSGESGAASYDDFAGKPVIGAYRPVKELDTALIVEQAQTAALADSEDLAVALIGATLAAVLLTALMAAAVTRRITLPIIELTATAVQIASGDLNQKVPTSRRDEIGILARAFNVMTTKLRVLYEDLEQKVKERTQQLEKANAEVRYQAMQLAISAEVGRVVTSILDRDLLLAQVVELIHDCFHAYFVAIYFVVADRKQAVFQEGSGSRGKQLKASNHRIDLERSQTDLITKTISSGRAQVSLGPKRRTDQELFPFTQARLAVPLKIGERVIGVLDVHSTHKDAFDGDEKMVLETLSGQIVVAIENARLYEIERQAAEHLREAEEMRRRFLANMSRELRMPLNNIIGFSRVILKGIDGPITDLQRQDLGAIYESGQQLLALFNDILDIAQIEAGSIELEIRPVDIGEIAESVIPTANALIQGRPLELVCEISPNLPPVLADPHRLRQVLVKLLSNAAKFTQEGEIKLRVWRRDGQILTSVIDTGIGIPDKDRDKVFEMFRQLSEPVDTYSRGTGLGLAFSKEIIKMHGGAIWFESKEGKGTAFTIALPVFEPSDSIE